MEFQYLDGGNSEVQDMQAEAYLYASSGTTGIAATGVIEGLVVAQTGTASGSVLIAAGACVNQASLGQGASRLINPSQKTLDIFTANPVGGLPRNDIVVFDSVTKLITVIVGTPNATPTDPTVAATEVALWRLRHDASATTIFTAHMDDLRVFTTLRQPAAAAWTAYTPVLTAVTTNPNIGTTGVSVGAYTKVGRTTFWRASITTGGTGVTAGSGQYAVNLPTAPAAAGIVGAGWFYSGTFLPFILDASTTACRIVFTTNGSVMTGGLTGAGNILEFSGSYESAT